MASSTKIRSGANVDHLVENKPAAPTTEIGHSARLTVGPTLKGSSLWEPSVHHPLEPLISAFVAD